MCWVQTLWSCSTNKPIRIARLKLGMFSDSRTGLTSGIPTRLLSSRRASVLIRVPIKPESNRLTLPVHSRKDGKPAQDALLGTMRDGELARRLKRSISSVRSRRNEVTSIRFIRTPNGGLHPICVCWDGCLMGNRPAYGGFLASVWNKRIQLGIARFSRLLLSLSATMPPFGYVGRRARFQAKTPPKAPKDSPKF